MAKSSQVGLLILSLLLVLGMTSGMEVSRRTRRAKHDDYRLTSYEDDCPNGLIAYEKFNIATGVFDCAIKTAEICFALCQLVESVNWDYSNSLSLRDQEDRDKWYCRALPGYPTRPCYFKPRREIEADVAKMFAPNWEP